MPHLFWLSDDAWATIEPHLPHGKPGKPRVDDRRVISGILHVLEVWTAHNDLQPLQQVVEAPYLAAALREDGCGRASA
jgi:Putative transposase of IS4/5 family (DUF4096)